MPVISLALEWRRLSDGPPLVRGTYFVAHSGMFREVWFDPAHPTVEYRKAWPYKGEHWNGRRACVVEPFGWKEDITWASHWAAVPPNFLPVDPSATQLCRAAGAAGYIAARDAQWASGAWQALADSLEAREVTP